MAWSMGERPEIEIIILLLRESDRNPWLDHDWCCDGVSDLGWVKFQLMMELKSRSIREFVEKHVARTTRVLVSLWCDSHRHEASTSLLAAGSKWMCLIRLDPSKWHCGVEDADFGRCKWYDSRIAAFRLTALTKCCMRIIYRRTGEFDGTIRDTGCESRFWPMS